MKTILKSIGACVIGMLVGAVPAIVTDQILETMGILPKENLYVAAWLIWVVLLYRTVYMVIGCYVIAALAPHHPMRHVIVMGVVGTLLSLMGAIANIQLDLGPDWYGFTLAALALPTAWVGGKLYLMRQKKT